MDLTDLTFSEISRLHMHPELFPSEVVAQGFWQDMYKISDYTLEEIIPHLKVNDKIMKKLGDHCAEDKLDMNFPRRNVLRKPWEQYLHDRAPGIEVDLSAQGDGGSVQIFPMAAIRIVMGMVEANKAIISDIERASATFFLQRNV